MKVIWSDESWNDFEYWLDTNKSNVKKIRKLIKDIKRHPFDGIGKPEPLHDNLSGLWSRRITNEQRLVYYVEDKSLNIVSARFHYSK